ncbi:MAG: hypothetical protein M4579_007271, partial [Chaenotheca gracillima]
RLHTLRNFHSLHAFLQGLRAAGYDAIIPQDLARLTQSESNYAATRRSLGHGPGIPFLFAHRREYELRGREALPEIFTPLALYPRETWRRPGDRLEYTVAMDGGHERSFECAGPLSSIWANLISCFS